MVSAVFHKTLVPAIVLQLVEENRLGLEDRLEKWLDRYPNIDPNVTVHQLLVDRI